MSVTEITRARECTAEQAAQWTARYSDGYKAGRGDAKWGQPRDGALVDIPAEVPGECGSVYAARHLGIAWRIGYTDGWTFTRNHRAR